MDRKLIEMGSDTKSNQFLRVYGKVRYHKSSKPLFSSLRRVQVENICFF